MLRVGFAEAKQRSTVTAGQTATANVQMRAVATTLAPVVTTATGEQRRVEVGNAIAQVDAAKIVETHAVSNVGDLLTSRAAGVTVFGGTQTGAGTRVRIRGTSSLSLTNNPIYVIDGIRVEGTTGSSTVERRRHDAGRGSATSIPRRSRTSRSCAGRRRRRSTAPTPPTASSSSRRSAASPAARSGRTTPSRRRSRIATTIPTAFGAGAPARRRRRPRRRRTPCSASSRRSRPATCVAGQRHRYNLHDDKESTPYGTGYRQQHGLQVRGGTEAVRYFLTANRRTRTASRRCRSSSSATSPRADLSLCPKQESPNHLTSVHRARRTSTSRSRATPTSRSTPATSRRTCGCRRATTPARPASPPTCTAAPDSSTTRRGRRHAVRLAAVHAARHLPGRVTKQAIERFITVGERELAAARLARVRGNFGVDYINRPTRSSAASRTARTSATTARASSATTARTSSSTRSTRPAPRRSASTDTSSRRRPPACSSAASSSTATARRARSCTPGGTTITQATIRTVRRDDDREPHARRLPRAEPRLQRPPVPHRRRSLRPQQRVRRRLQDGVLSEALGVVGHLGGVVLPAGGLPEPAAPAHGVRRLGRAAGNHRRRAVLHDDSSKVANTVGEAGDVTGLVFRRSATASSSPSGRRSSSSASTARSGTAASRPSSRTTTRRRRTR